MKTGIVTFSTIIVGLLITAAIIATSSCIVGCGEEEVVKGEEGPIEEPAAKPPEPTSPEPTPPQPEDPAEPKLSNLDKARELYKKAEERANEIIGDGPPIHLPEAFDTAYKETFGFGAIFVGEKLVGIYFEEKPEEKKKGWTEVPLVIEYLRLSLKFPNKLEDGLLRLFRESIRAGNVSADPENPKPSREPEEDED